MSKYTVVADYGKPYDIKVDSEKMLHKELLKLKRLSKKGDYPYFDVRVYDENDKDVSFAVFKKFGM